MNLDVEVTDEFVELVADELETPSEDWIDVDPVELCKAVIKVARLRSGENFA